MASGWGDGRAGAPADWKPQRIGIAPPDITWTLRAEVANAVLSLAGVPPTLFGGGRAEGKREALRQFQHETLQPLAKKIQREAQAKLLAAVTLDFTALGALDVQGRTRAFKSLTDGGMAAAEAARVTGLAIDDALYRPDPYLCLLRLPDQPLAPKRYCARCARKFQLTVKRRMLCAYCFSYSGGNGKGLPDDTDRTEKPHGKEPKDLRHLLPRPRPRIVCKRAEPDQPPRAGSSSNSIQSIDQD